MTATFTAPASAYYTFSWDLNFDTAVAMANVTQTTTISVSSCYLNSVAAGNNTVMSIVPHPDFANTQSANEGVRMISSYIWMKNTASNLYKQGIVHSSQMPTKIDWWDLLADDNLIKRSNGVEKIGYEKGFVSYMKPGSDQDFDFLDEFDVADSGAISDSHYELITESTYLATVTTVTDATGQAGEVTLCSAVEFKTTDTTRDVMYTNTLRVDMEKAIDILRAAPFLFENETHIRDIFNAIGEGIKSGVEFASKYGPYIGQAFELISSLVA
jgi:hypothetical protein